VTGSPGTFLSIAPDGAGGYDLRSLPAGLNVYSTTNLADTVDWTFEGITPLSVSPNPFEPQKFFQIRP
jgi:hypothetical protein